MSTELLGIIIAIIGLAWGFYIYYNRQTPDYRDSKSYMLSQFEFLKRLNSSVIEQYESFAQRYDAYDVTISEGLTFRWGIEKMKTLRNELTDEAYNELTRTTASIKHIESATENIKKQIEYHSGLQTTLELFQNHINLNHQHLNDTNEHL